MSIESDEPAWEQQLPGDVRTALSSAIGAGGVPSQALALFARWWQLETWLRSVAYVELRAQSGVDWAEELGEGAEYRRQTDKKHSYMASPDWEDPIAYLDAGKLFNLIDRKWSILEPALLDKDVWDGRRSELLKIRNRIGHLRRPHADDLGRLEQTLRDLEGGAFRALASYNKKWSASNLSGDDPVVSAWVLGNHGTARRLINHVESNYDTSFELALTVRPWADRPGPGELASGTPGLLWRASFYQRQSYPRPTKLWRDSYLDACARRLLVHLMVDVLGVSVTFPAVDDPDQVSDAIGGVFDAVLTTSTRTSLYDGKPLDYIPFRGATLDSRVQIDTPWTIIDEDTTPVSIFGA